MNTIEVSVIVPAYNCARYLPETLESIRRQGHDDLEVIVVDDGSTDSTAAVAEAAGPPVVCVRRANGGPGAARNTGLQRAHGRFIAFLDGDDLWPDGTLSRQLATLAERPEAAAVMGRTEVFARVKAGEEVREVNPFGDPVRGAFLSATVCRRAAADAVGPFNEDLRISEDYDWLTRLREHGHELVLVEEVTHRYRRHDTNLTIGAQFSSSNLASVLKRSLDRRRGEHGAAPALPDLRPVGQGNRAEARLQLRGWQERA